MRIQLEKSWDAFQVFVEKSEKELVQYVEQVFDGVCRTLEGMYPMLEYSDVSQY
jgi:hypothetical protein